MKTITLTWDELEKMKPKHDRYYFDGRDYYLKQFINELQDRIKEDADDYTARVSEQAKRAGFTMPAEQKQIVRRRNHGRLAIGVVGFAWTIALAKEMFF
jgi:hypothetical protein